MVHYKTVKVPVESDSESPSPPRSSHQNKSSKQTSSSHTQSGKPFEPLPKHEKATGGASAAKLHQVEPERITEAAPKDRNEFKEDIHKVPFKEGQRVEYVPIGGPNSHTSMSTGKIERVLTSKTTAGDKHVAVNASEDQPQYEIVNDNTHKKTALKGRNLINVIDDPEK